MASGQRTKIPQIGIVIVEDDVEIGANSAIDRSTMGSTIIKKGSKLDNLVQIGHNVVVGENSVLCGQAGVAGSTKIGNNVIIGGQAAINGHITIGDYVRVAGDAGVANNIKEKEIVMGSPAMDFRKYRRSAVVTRNLPELSDRILKLEKELAALKENKENK